ncbi:MAG: M16 family metallopeptidase [Flavobacteriales bacterium]
MRRYIFWILVLLSANFYSQEYSYKTYKNDPTGLRLYTLDNGLTVYLAKNTDEPKIQTYIAVRAGSSYDPSDNTGLAHYLEHMLFKGTPKIGTQNWEKERKVLEELTDLYEKHKEEPHLEKKKLIYKKIDSLSYKASKLAIANEYDNMIQSIGAEGVNAHTWHEETIYKSKIPSNSLNKWLKLESERFSQLVLRLFHTELEAVYEEFNRAQDNDRRRIIYPLMEQLFPNHPYGQQTTLGKSEHLKNPSMKAIYAYFKKYYVPNNMAIVLVGDLNYDQTIKWIDQSFGGMKSQELKHPVLPKEKPLTQVLEKEVITPSVASVTFAYRSEGIHSDQRKKVRLLDMILSNSKAGLIDLELNQKNKVQEATCYPNFFNDYGLHTFRGLPKEGQSLEEVRDLILDQINRIKKGDFDEWLIEAVINDLKLNTIKRYEQATNIATAYYRAFVHFRDWQDELNFLEELKTISKAELVAFANQFYKDNYVIVYKRRGEDKSLVKVEKPEITPIELNRDKSSHFFQNFSKIKVEAIKPHFIDFKEEIELVKLKNGLELSYIENKTNDLFYLAYIYDMGSENMKKLPLAINYLKLLGTDQYTPSEINQEFYKLGINFGVNVNDNRSYVYLNGLRENLEEGLTLLEHLMQNVKPSSRIYQDFIDAEMKDRENVKIKKEDIFWTGLFNMALYGENSSLRNRYSEEELRSIKPVELTSIIKELKEFKHYAFYYGKDKKSVKKLIEKSHKVKKLLKEYPEREKHTLVEANNTLYFTNYDMVQTELAFLAKDVKFNKENIALIELFKTYFGSGLSSIVFQELRESKSLAYSSFSSYTLPKEKEDEHIVYAYIGTQNNKLSQAVEAMQELMNNLPKSEKQFQSAKVAVLKKMEAKRITKDKIYWKYKALQDLGINYNNREEIYNQVKNTSFEDLKQFFDKHIKRKQFNYILIGNKEHIDFESLKKLGKFKEVGVDYLFDK